MLTERNVCHRKSHNTIGYDINIDHTATKLFVNNYINLQTNTILLPCILDKTPNSREITDINISIHIHLSVCLTGHSYQITHLNYHVIGNYTYIVRGQSQYFTNSKSENCLLCGNRTEPDRAYNVFASFTNSPY